MKPWDDIVLTEEEKEAAIVEGKKRKWFHERNKEYWEAQERTLNKSRKSCKIFPEKVVGILIAIAFVVTSCGPAAKLRRAEKLIAKAEEQGAVWHVDTVYQMTPIEIESVRVDSVIIALPGDTVTIEKDRLKIKYVRLPADSVFIEGECKGDTIYKAVPVVVNKSIEAKGWLRWWHLVIAGLVGAGLVALFRK